MAFKRLAFFSLVLSATPVVAKEDDSDVAQMFTEMDTDKDGSLSLEEFGGLSGEDQDMSAEELAKAKEEIKEDFNKLDEDKNGRLSQVEMAKDTMEDETSAMEDETSAMEEGAEEQDLEEGAEGADEEGMEEGMEEGTEDKDDADEMEDVGLLEEGDGEAEEESMGTQQFVQQTMHDLDRDDDNQLSLEEFQADAPDAEAKKHMEEDFNKADKDKNLKLSIEEYQALMELDDKPSSKA